MSNFNPAAMLRGMKIMEPADVGYLDEIMLSEGHIQPVRASDLGKVPTDHILQWCVKNAVYQIPTVELIDWIREKIAGRRAIEIGTGQNCIGRELGIPCTDSYMQTKPEIAAYYATFGQTPIVPDESYVEKLDAIEAVEKYDPEVVVGCFITHKFKQGMADGNEFGVEEEKIIDRATYINVGNLRPHKNKPIRKLPHEEFSFPWLISRAIDQSLNRIWIWSHQ